VHTISDYQAFFTTHLSKSFLPKAPINLYDPIQYIVQLGGKRLRPVLTLMAADIFGSTYDKALDAALAVEVFHNFSLVHDDIMDHAPLRRGQQTVHEKWDVNTGILSGDAMLIQAYQLFENYEGAIFKELVALFSTTAIQVCEGQQYDMDFEVRDDVTLPEYLQMIESKTAVLVGAALQMGAIIAGASPKSKTAIYDFGRVLGIAFQLQDDYLDAFGDPATFGKQVGGDIMANKKTYLYLKALESATTDQKQYLTDLFLTQPDDPADKITAVKQLFESTGTAERTQKAIQAYTQQAFEVLRDLEVAPEKQALLHTFGQQLMNRTV